MTLTRWQNCDLDPSGAQALLDFEDELHTLEASFDTQASTLATRIADNNLSAKVAPTLVLRTSAGADGIRLTWLDSDDAPFGGLVLKGTRAHRFGIIINSVDTSGLGTLDAAYDDDTCTLRINPTFNGDKQINLTTDDLITNVLDGWNTVFSSTNLAPGATIGSTARRAFSGGKNAAVTSTVAALNRVFAGTGVTWQRALNQLSVPTAATSDSAEDIFQSISDYVILSTGKTLIKSGSNLVAIRELWTLMGGTLANATALATVLGAAEVGAPVVQWTQTVTTTVTLAKCDGGGTRTTSTTSALGALNTNQSATSGATPTVWWIEKITATDGNLKKLASYGLSRVQIEGVLNAGNTNTHLIEATNFLGTYGLTTAEFYELLGYSEVEGVAAADFEDALDSVTNKPASLNTGWLSPALSIPPSHLLSKLSPAQSMAADITAIRDSSCIDPINKAPIIAFVSAVDNMMKAVVRQVQQLTGLVRGFLSQVGGVLSSVQKFLDDLEATTCVTGLNFSTNGSLDLLLTELELFSEDIKVTFSTVDTMLELILPPPCKIENAIKELLGPLYPGENCLIEGISDLAVNAYGRLKGLLPCINNPLSVLEIFNKLSIKTGALSSLVNGMLADLRRIQTQLNMIADIQSQDRVEETTSDCQSSSLSVMVGRIRAVF